MSCLQVLSRGCGDAQGKLPIEGELRTSWRRSGEDGAVYEGNEVVDGRHV